MLPELPALQLEIDEHHRHKDVYEHTLTVLEQAIDLETGPDGPVPAPDFVLRFAALMHDVGKPRTRRFEEGAASPSTTTRWSAPRSPGSGCRRCASATTSPTTCPGWSSCTCASTATARASGPTRRCAGTYATPGRCWPGCIKLTRADCTTRNKRRAAELAAQIDDLEARIARLEVEEGLAALRPDLDGEQIMAILGVPPGPVVGKAYRFLLDLRLDRGPLGPEAAEAELRTWWATQS